jgi:alpha-tubulin suppressor-like RCC1 family protein
MDNYTSDNLSSMVEKVTAGATGALGNISMTDASGGGTYDVNDLAGMMEKIRTGATGALGNISMGSFSSSDFAAMKTKIASGGSGALGNIRMDDYDHSNPGSAYTSAITGTKPAIIASNDTALTTCYISGEGNLKCWGNNNKGQLGLGDTDTRGDGSGEMGSNLPNVNLGTGRTAIGVSTGSGHTCALLDNGAVKCWGYNHKGQLGIGSTTDSLTPAAVNLGSGRTATLIAVGEMTSCAKLDNGDLKCWGSSNSSMLGFYSSSDSTTPAAAIDFGTGRTAASVELGKEHGCAILDNGAVMCWARGAGGRLGNGSTSNCSTPCTIGLGTGRTATAIASGIYHNCAIMDNSSVKCWGVGFNGRLGSGNTDHLGDASGEMGDNLPEIDLGTGRTAIAIAAGAEHNCAILDNGSVKCWGQGDFGRLGYGNTNDLGDEANEMGDNLPVVDLGTGRTAIAITASANGTCVILDNSSVKCWGGGGGWLGLGDRDARGDESGEMGDNLPIVDL